MPLSHCLDWWAKTQAFRICLTASSSCIFVLSFGLCCQRVASGIRRSISRSLGDLAVQEVINYRRVETRRRGRAWLSQICRSWAVGADRGQQPPAAAARPAPGAPGRLRAGLGRGLEGVPWCQRGAFGWGQPRCLPPEVKSNNNDLEIVALII